MVTAGDTGRKEANASREVGLHAIFSGLKSLASDQKGRKSDQELMEWGFTLLDCLEAHLRHRAEHRLELKSKTVYKADDGLIWAIKHGSQGSSFAAFDEGARLVVFEGEPIEVEGGTTYPVGIMRGGEWTEPHVEGLVNIVGYRFDHRVRDLVFAPGGVFRRPRNTQSAELRAGRNKLG